MIPAIPFLGIYPKEVKSAQKAICTSMFIAALFTIDKVRKRRKCMTTDKWNKIKCGTHICMHIYICEYTHVYIYNSWILFSYKKKSSHLWHHRQSWWILHKVKQTRQRMPNDITFMWNLERKSNSSLQYKSACQGLVDGRNRQRSVNGYKFSVM